MLAVEHIDAPDDLLRELMAGYQDGSLEAFDRLYAALQHELHRFFSVRCRDAQRVEDLVQEAFLQLHRSRRSYLRSLPVRPWVYAIARRVFLMYLRTAQRREFPEATSLADVAEPHAGASDGFIARLELADALGNVPVDGRRAFLLHHWRGLSFREIAIRLRIQPGAAKLRSSRAASRLRRLLTVEGTSRD
jgi:RNA polymerase sigma-70 factor (ECF subfamily)